MGNFTMQISIQCKQDKIDQLFYASAYCKIKPFPLQCATGKGKTAYDAINQALQFLINYKNSIENSL